MAEKPEEETVFIKYLGSLETLTVYKVVDVLMRLNDCRIDSQFPWLSKQLNPFIGVPHQLIENIIDRFILKMRSAHRIIRKELLEILICKPLKILRLSGLDAMGDEDMLDVLKILDSSQSKVTYLEIDRRDLEIKIPRSLTFLKEYVKGMPSLTHLSVNGICDDQLLEAVAFGCPNLLELHARSKDITSKGLKMLCMNISNDPDSKGCLKLRKIYLDSNGEEDYLLEGIQALLLHLPYLFILQCSHITLGKAIEKLHKETHETKQFQIREFCYDGSFDYSCLPTVIATMCPFLQRLCIINASNVDLTRFECIHALKALSISPWDDMLNFGQDIAPFIQKMGKCLEDLSLRDVVDINFNSIDEHCPNLIRLECDSKDGLTGTISENPVFRNLEELHLVSSMNIGLQPIDCIRLLSHCHKLTDVSLFCCENLNMDHLKEITRRNPLSNLDYVDITSNTLSVYSHGMSSNIK